MFHSCFSEYAYSTKATEKSDIYSMGIMFMEIFSGKMRTDATIRSNMDMQGIEREELIDSELKPLLAIEEFSAFQVLEIAIQCTKVTPQERPSSRKVCDLLHHVSKNKKVNFEKMDLDHCN